MHGAKLFLQLSSALCLGFASLNLEPFLAWRIAACNSVATFLGKLPSISCWRPVSVEWVWQIPFSVNRSLQNASHLDSSARRTATRPSAPGMQGQKSRLNKIMKTQMSVLFTLAGLLVADAADPFKPINRNAVGTNTVPGLTNRYNPARPLPNNRGVPGVTNRFAPPGNPVPPADPRPGLPDPRIAPPGQPVPPPEPVPPLDPVVPPPSTVPFPPATVPNPPGAVPNPPATVPNPPAVVPPPSAPTPPPNAPPRNAPRTPTPAAPRR